MCVYVWSGHFCRLHQHTNVSHMPRPYLSPINTIAENQTHTHRTLSLSVSISLCPILSDFNAIVFVNFAETSFNLPNVKYFKFDNLLCFNRTSDRQTNRVHLIHNILYRIIDKNFRLICSPMLAFAVTPFRKTP